MPQTTPNNTTTQQAEGFQLFLYQIIKTRKTAVQNCPLLSHESSIDLTPVIAPRTRTNKLTT